MEKEKTLLVPKEGNTLEMFLNVSQKDLCCILDSNPSLKKILEMDLSFGDYIKIIASTADKIEGVREKKEKLVKHINCFLGKFNNEISISDLPSIVNTGDHYGILSEKAPFYGELIYEKYLEELGKDKILSLAWENISMNNPSFPRGIILDEKSKIAFVADKYKHLNFSDGCVKIKDKKEIIKQIDQSKLSEKIKEKIKNILESNKEEDLVRIVYLINYQLWKEINNKEFHMIPFVKIITDYLLENKELFTELFLNNPQIIKKHLEGKFGGYSVIDGKTKGTSIGYYIIKNGKNKKGIERIQREGILIDHKGFYYENNGIKNQLNNEEIIFKIELGEIQISLSVAYILLLDMGILPIGGVSQIHYMEYCIDLFGEITGKDTSKFKNGLYIFSGFNFGEFKFYEKQSKRPNFEKINKQHITQLIDFDYLTMIYC